MCQGLGPKKNDAISEIDRTCTVGRSLSREIGRATRPTPRRDAVFIYYVLYIYIYTYIYIYLFVYYITLYCVLFYSIPILFYSNSILFYSIILFRGAPPRASPPARRSSSRPASPAPTIHLYIYIYIYDVPTINTCQPCTIHSTLPDRLGGQMTPDYCIWVECRLQRLRWKRTSLYPGRPSR